MPDEKGTLRTAVDRLLAARDATEVGRLLSQHPELGGREADELLRGRVRAARRAGEFAAADGMAQRRRQLARIGRTGADPGADAQFRRLYDAALRAAQRAEAVNDPGALDTAIAAWERAVEASPADRVARSATATSASRLLLVRFERTGSRADLARAHALAATAVELADGSNPHRPGLLVNLANVLRAMSRVEPDPAAELRFLSDAVAAYEAALAEGGSSPVFAALIDYGLGSALALRYEHTGRAADVDDGIRHLESALQLTRDPMRRRRCAGALGSALMRRFDHAGVLGDLERAIGLHEELIEMAGGDGHGRSRASLHLGLGLGQRYEATGDVADLHRAIASLEAALEALAEGNPDRAVALNTLAQRLMQRRNLEGRPEDGERAILVAEAAVAHVDAGRLQRSARLGNLGGALLSGLDGAPARLDRAVELLEEAVELGGNEAQRARLLDMLGTALGLRFDRDRRPADLERAIECHGLALDGLPDGAPTEPAALAHLAGALLQLEQAGGLGEEPGPIFRRAVARGLEIEPGTALRAARAWGASAAGREAWAEAAEAYSSGLQAAALLHERQLGVQAKESWLVHAQGLAGRAAYALARVGDPSAAIVAAERGRAVMLSEALERDRADLDQLRAAGRGDAADRFRLAGRRLANVERGGPDVDIAGRTAQVEWDRSRREARSEFEEALAGVRAFPGYEGFLRRPELGDVLAAAHDAPLVYLVAGEHGGVALIAERGGVRAVRLDALRDTLEGVLGLLEPFLRRDAPEEEWAQAVDGVTRWCWDAAMGPVIEALGDARRAVLVPFGLLSLLPLHAAWTEDDGGRRYALDALALSYTPSAGALRVARRTAGRRSIGGALAIEDPRPASAPPLPGAAEEVAALMSRVPGTRHLAGTAATREDVLAALPSAGLAHFACHGVSSPWNPLASHLLMAGDERLTLRDLVDIDLPARLAVLSACDTAIPGVELPDELIGLPSGMLQAGASGVIGSLWQVGDETTALLMRRFYRGWLDDGLEPAEALRAAQRWLRDARRADHAAETPELFAASAERVPEPLRPFWRRARMHAAPVHWAAFIHVGA